MAKLHSLLLRQLKRAGIDEDNLDRTTQEQWVSLLEKISAAYDEDDKYRYTMTRSMDVSSQEMDELNRKLEYERDKLESMISDGVCVVNNNFEIESINDEAAHLLGVEKGKALGKRFSELCLLYDISGEKKLLSLDKIEVKDDGNTLQPMIDCEFAELESMMGGVTPVSISINYLISAQDNLGGLIIVRNMTERANVEAKLHDAVVALEEAQAKHKQLAYFDSLTSMPNRHQFEIQLENSIVSSKLNQGRFALLYIDIDNFKMINDNFGHNVGDTLLRYISSRLYQSLRSSDFVARIGGDEFAIIIDDVTDLKQLGDKASQIIESFKKPFNLKGTTVTVGVSIGVAVFPLAGKNVNALLRNSDIAMYHAKRKGRNNFQFFTDELNERYKRWYQIDVLLQSVIDRDELFLVYQPIYNMDTNLISGFEVLLRWSNATLGMVPPEEFIPIAEENKTIITIGEWVLENAFEQYADWIALGYEDLSIKINVSSEQLLYSDFTCLIDAMIKKFRVNPELIECEITETAIMVPVESLDYVMAKLVDLGVRLSIDDFGTGYSSIHHLQKLPVHTIKIDKLFVATIAEGSKELLIVKSLISMANNLDLNVIAEGVETEQQLSLLKENNCKEAQGFFYSEPLTAEDFFMLLRDSKK